MKIYDMTNEQLGYWCAKAQGWKKKYPYNNLEPYWLDDTGTIIHSDWEYHPTTNWQQAGELVEKFEVAVYMGSDDSDQEYWFAKCTVGGMGKADTPTRAICMAVIASVYGEEIDG